MRQTSDQLIGLKVQTRGGEMLGRLKDIEIDCASMRLRALIVSPSSLLKKIIESDLVVPIEDVIEITEELIIVDDAVVTDKGTKIGVEDYTRRTSPSPLESRRS